MKKKKKSYYQSTKDAKGKKGPNSGEKIKINVTNIETVFISAPNNDFVLAGSLAFVLLLRLLRLLRLCVLVCTTGQC